MPQVYYGGSFAPQLTQNLLNEYIALINETDAQTKLGDYLRKILKPVTSWWQLPESTTQGDSLHKSGRAILMPLDEEIKNLLWEDLPWEEEVEIIQQEFEQLPSGPLRNAAFHLLWHVKELNLDREPITLDKLL